MIQQRIYWFAAAISHAAVDYFKSADVISCAQLQWGSPVEPGGSQGSSPRVLAEVEESERIQARYLKGTAFMRCPVRLISFYWPRWGPWRNPISSNGEIYATILFCERNWKIKYEGAWVLEDRRPCFRILEEREVNEIWSIRKTRVWRSTRLTRFPLKASWGFLLLFGTQVCRW